MLRKRLRRPPPFVVISIGRYCGAVKNEIFGEKTGCCRHSSDVFSGKEKDELYHVNHSRTIGPRLKTAIHDGGVDALSQDTRPGAAITPPPSGSTVRLQQGRGVSSGRRICSALQLSCGTVTCTQSTGVNMSRFSSPLVAWTRWPPNRESSSRTTVICWAVEGAVRYCARHPVGLCTISSRTVKSDALSRKWMTTYSLGCASTRNISFVQKISVRPTRIDWLIDWMSATQQQRQQNILRRELAVFSVALSTEKADPISASGRCRITHRYAPYRGIRSFSTAKLDRRRLLGGAINRKHRRSVMPHLPNAMTCCLLQKRLIHKIKNRFEQFEKDCQEQNEMPQKNVSSQWINRLSN